MLEVTQEQQDALGKPGTMLRSFVWVDALHPETGLPDPAGFWNDAEAVEIEGRLYHPSSVVQVSAVASVADLTVAGLTITLSKLVPRAASLVRASNLAQRPVEYDLGIFDVTTRALIGPLVPQFRGWVDDVEIETPVDGGAATVVLICESVSRALTISGTATRSDASQSIRDPNDKIYTYANAQRLPVLFGKAAPQ